MVMLIMEPPPAAASEGLKVGAQPFAVGMFGSHGGSACRPVIYHGWFQPPSQVRDMMHA